jgi:hypothetical protein
MIAVYLCFQFTSPGRRTDIGPMIWFTFFPIFRSMHIWGERRPGFSMELLFPWTKREMTLAMFAGSAVDFAAVLLIPCMCFPIANYWLEWNLSAAETSLTLIATVTGGAIFWVGTLWILTIRHDALVVTVAITGMLMITGGAAVTSVYLSGGRHAGLSSVLTYVSLGNCLVTALLGVSAYRRWLQMEWA